MSWDISVFASSTPPPPVEGMTDTWQLAVLGTCQQVRDRISLVLPATDWSDHSWGRFEGDGFTFEFNIGEKESTDGFMIHVRGGGDAVGALLQLAKGTSWFFLDCSTGEWLHQCREPETGWQNFQAFRDSVFSRGEGEPNGPGV